MRIRSEEVISISPRQSIAEFDLTHATLLSSVYSTNQVLVANSTFCDGFDSPLQRPSNNDQLDVSIEESKSRRGRAKGQVSPLNDCSSHSAPTHTYMIAAGPSASRMPP